MKKISLAEMALCLLMIFGLAEPIKAHSAVNGLWLARIRRQANNRLRLQETASRRPPPHNGFGHLRCTTGAYIPVMVTTLETAPHI